MSTIDRLREVHTEEPPPDRKQWLAAIAAVMVILAAAGLTLLVRGRSPAEVTNPPASTTTTSPDAGALDAARLERAGAIAAAFYTLDPSAFLAAVENPGATVDAALTAQANAAALNERVDGTSTCVTRASAVACTTRTSNDLKEALFTTSADMLRIVFDGASVVAVEWSTGSQATFDRFFEWLDGTSVDAPLADCDGAASGTELASCWQGRIALVPGYVNQRDTGSNSGIAEQILDAWLAEDIDEVVALTSDIFNPNLPSGLEQAVLLNTTVFERSPCGDAGRNLVECTLIVEDDFLREFGAQRTDTLKVFFFDAAGYVVDVQWESQEPEQVEAYWVWLAENRPDVTEGACSVPQGTIPDDLAGCWAARIAAVPDFLASQ